MYGIDSWLKNALTVPQVIYQFFLIYIERLTISNVKFPILSLQMQ